MAISLQPEYLKRYKDIAQLFWKYGRGDLLTHSGITFPLDGEAKATEASGQPEELARELEAMGPLYIKLGQLLSSRVDLLPAPYIHALSRLQDNLPPFSFAEVEQIVEAELGVRMSKAFESFESTPIASASLGQVHRAKLRDGRDVAVKVQRPGVREEIAKELSALRDIAEFLDHHTELGEQYRFVQTLDELQHSLARELDYVREAKNLVEIGHNLQEFDRIIIPQPVEDYCTARVLTMDYIQGRKITEIGPLAQLSMDGKQIAEQLFQAYLKQILVGGLFHADPHPGNIFLTNDYHLALLDLGMTGRLSPSMQEELLKLLLAVSEGKGDAATRIGISIGERVSEKTIAEAELSHRVSQVLEERMAGSIERMQVGLALMDFSRICLDNGFRMPIELTMLGKTLLNLDTVGRILDPTFDPSKAIQREAFRLTQRRLTKSLTPANLLASAIEAKEFTLELPRRVNKILDALAKNELTFRVDAIEEDTLIDGFQKIANRIATGLILAAFIIGAAMLMRVDTPFKIFGYPGLAILFFFAAAIGAVWLLFEIAAHDRKIRKK